MHAETLNTLAERARRAGHIEIAAAWRRHLAALDPLSARYAVSFVRALLDAGDIPGALRHAGLFERLVRSELDTDVGPEMRLLVAQLRRRADGNASKTVSSEEMASIVEVAGRLRVTATLHDLATGRDKMTEPTGNPVRCLTYSKLVRACHGHRGGSAQPVLVKSRPRFERIRAFLDFVAPSATMTTGCLTRIESLRAAGR